ncbi:hypothetical protein WKV44_06245 [Spirochaetia bacterium 38H-sp]|uniref:Outer membrane lipoprotein carrier protein LolA n=1 Tax=Rarispira pelagica TaxID=3141764 RepID=A0ABU9UDB0_9SPIR
MKIYRLCVVFLVLVFFSVFPVFADNPEPDASIVIKQTALNKFLEAIGPLSNKERFSVAGVRGEYVWEIRNPRIVLESDRARFEGDVSVKVPSLRISYTAPARGEVSVRYDLDSNRIKVRVTRASFDVVVKVLGKRLKVAEVDLARFYTIAFDFPGPKPFESFVEVTLPDKRKKDIRITTVPVLRIEKGQIVVGSELRYSPSDKR